jgi:Tn3 transposase DDE domain
MTQNHKLLNCQAYVPAQHPACAQLRESYHKLVRAVAYANGGKLRVRTDQEQQLWSECSRLLANCIIYYNACILSELLERAERRQVSIATLNATGSGFRSRPESLRQNPRAIPDRMRPGPARIGLCNSP